jgi:outer membrane protein W
MEKLITVFALFLFAATLSLAQVNSNYDGPKPEVREGSKSFVFQYTPFQSTFNPVNVGVTSYANAGGSGSTNLVGAGFQYFFTNEIAVGLGLNFGSSSSSLEQTAGTTDNKVTTFGIGVDANYHLKSLYGISPYVGLNLNLASYSGSDEFTPTGGTLVKTEYSGSGLGGGVQFGFDWYFTEGLSLGGKYTLGFRSLGKPEVKSAGTTVEGASGSFFGIGTASVMLNVHF